MTRFLPKAYVRKVYRREEVDLQPAGATVAIRTRADNPMTDGRLVSVEPASANGIFGKNPYLAVGPRVTPRKNYWRPGIAGIVSGKIPATMAMIPGMSGGAMPGMGGFWDWAGNVGSQAANIGLKWLENEVVTSDGPKPNRGSTTTNQAPPLVSYPPADTKPKEQGISTNTMLLVGGGLAAAVVLAVALSGRRR